MNRSSKTKLLLNTFTAFLLQIVVIVCNFILPRLYLQFYNSEANGLIQSISQFLGFISLCELGIGQVIQTSLYKPLAENDVQKVSCVVASGKRFFRRIAYILCVYIVILIAAFSTLPGISFEREYVTTLILVMSVSSFAQYYFGIIDSLLLNADQRNYINSIAQIVATILNTIICTILIISGFSLQYVKFFSSLILIIKPIVVHIYVRKRYNIDTKIRYEGEPIAQKWNGIAQHVASYILSGTDTMVLTFFSTLGNISVYSIYNMIANGINLLLHSFPSGLRSYFGRLWASQNMKEIKKVFKGIELGFHSLTVFLYTCTGILIVPFVRVYTQGITDYDYVQPLFAFLLVTSYALQGIRVPYSILIHVAGRYKQTQNCYVVSAIINLAVSIFLVSKWGLIGIAFGTALSMIVQVLWLVIYNSKNVLYLSLLEFGKICLMDFLAVIFSCIVVHVFIPESFFYPRSYYDWVILALLVALVAGIILITIVLLFYRKTVKIALHNFLIIKMKE